MRRLTETEQWEANDRARAEDRAADAFDDEAAYLVDELYCDYCEREGHTFRSCPRRDDSG